MTKFNYQARNKEGKLIFGELDSVSAQAAAKELIGNGFTPVEIKGGSLPFDFLKIFNVKRITAKELAIFFRQLGVIYAAGVPFYESLTAVRDQMVNKDLVKVVKRLADDIEAGSTFHHALSVHPDLFSPLIITMIEAGEKGGMLGDVLARISTFLERDNELKMKIKAALRYPLIVIFSLVSAFIACIMFVIPQFSKMFGAFGTQLPLPTRMLLGVNYVLVHFWWLMVILFFMAIFSYRAFRNTPYGKYQTDFLLMRAPVFGELTIKIALSRFFSMLSAMINSGIPIVYGLEITANTVDNAVISRAIGRIQEKVTAGDKLSESLKEFKFFPPLSIQMIAIGESSGNLENMLNRSAAYFDEETDYTVSNMMTLIEPIMIFFLGLLVTLLALGIYLPMWSIMDLYKH